MTPEQLFDLFRTQVNDVATPHLWTDDEVWAYMNEAERMFCRLTDGISDASSAACSVGLVVGEAFSALHPSILTIRHAQRVSDSASVAVVNFQDITNGRASDDYGQARSYRLDDRAGRVDCLVVGMERNKARWVAIPEVADAVSLIIYRLPLDPVTEASTCLEVGEEHHFSLMHWMQHLAYAKADAETFDRASSAAHKEAFELYCMQAKAEQGRYKHKTRVVQYGGL